MLNQHSIRRLVPLPNMFWRDMGGNRLKMSPYLHMGWVGPNDSLRLSGIRLGDATGRQRSMYIIEATPSHIGHAALKSNSFSALESWVSAFEIQYILSRTLHNISKSCINICLEWKVYRTFQGNVIQTQGFPTPHPKHEIWKRGRKWNGEDQKEREEE